MVLDGDAIFGAFHSIKEGILILAEDDIFFQAYISFIYFSTSFILKWFLCCLFMGCNFPYNSMK